jgi:rare lipoprotein A
MQRLISLIILIFISTLWGCGESPRPEVRHSYVGLASHYGPEWDGRRTASGEIFHNSALTAAHRTLPFGTRVRVTLLSTGKSVTVRINDRGPFVKGRIIDLSDEAARRIGMGSRGVAPVRLEVLGS